MKLPDGLKAENKIYLNFTELPSKEFRIIIEVILNFILRYFIIKVVSLYKNEPVRKSLPGLL
jgi:hypothetical protein